MPGATDTDINGYRFGFELPPVVMVAVE